MTPLGEAIIAAAEAQGWLVVNGEYGTVMATSPVTFQAFLLDDAILADTDLEAFLRAQLEMMVRYGSLVWPWPPASPLLHPQG